jgi:hypothetical protein
MKKNRSEQSASWMELGAASRKTKEFWQGVMLDGLQVPDSQNPGFCAFGLTGEAGAGSGNYGPCF